MTQRKRIALISTGGTIAMEGAHAFDWLNYGANGKVNSVTDILQTLDLGIKDVEIKPVALKALPSVGITPADWRDLAHCVRDVLASDKQIDGIVVTHGTATLEETAFFMHLVHAARQPVIFTGAQRPPNTASSDATANLRAAVLAASDERLQGAGCLVCFNHEIFAASDVTKAANFTLDAFSSPRLGALGKVGPEGSLTLLRTPDCAGSGAFAKIDLASPLPRVDIVFSYAGADATLIEAALAAGARGIVSIGLPPGRGTPLERKALENAAKTGVTIIQSSRALRDGVPEQPYNASAGILSAGALAANKARILLMLALAARVPNADIQRLLLAFP